MPYNDIVFHLEREMRLSGLGAPDEVTLVQLNKVEATQPQDKTKQTQNKTQNIKKGYCFYSNKFRYFKAECQKMKWENGNKLATQAQRPN